MAGRDELRHHGGRRLTSPPTITYNCDSDPGTSQPNFQISSDTCTGATLAPQEGCSLQITYVPQANTVIPSGGLDFFLELNTLQCWPAGTTPSESNPCEIDSGRFPVELKANGPSTLRMSPSAGLDFGYQKKGTTSAPLTITLLNDPDLATTQTVNFVGEYPSDRQLRYSEWRQLLPRDSGSRRQLYCDRNFHTQQRGFQ